MKWNLTATPFVGLHLIPQPCIARAINLDYLLESLVYQGFQTKVGLVIQQNKADHTLQYLRLIKRSESRPIRRRYCW